MSFENIDPATAHQRMTEGDWVYVDVRTPEEYAGGHPDGAINIPVATRSMFGMKANPQFVEQITAQFEAGHSLIIGCASGGRSRSACQMLAGAGFQLANLDGGYRDWCGCGLPTKS